METHKVSLVCFSIRIRLTKGQHITDLRFWITRRESGGIQDIHRWGKVARMRYLWYDVPSASARI